MHENLPRDTSPGANLYGKGEKRHQTTNETFHETRDILNLFSRAADDAFNRPDKLVPLE